MASERRAYLIRVVNELLKFDTTAEQIVLALEAKGVNFDGASE